MRAGLKKRCEPCTQSYHLPRPQKFLGVMKWDFPAISRVDGLQMPLVGVAVLQGSREPDVEP